MAIPDVSRNEIIAALELFDSQQRGTPEWEGWEQRENHKYAIQYEGRLYPVKHIIGLAAGVGTNTFSGGDEANSFVQRRGLTIVPLDREPAGLNTLIQRFVDRYGTFSSADYLKDERDYKLAASQKLRDLLSRERMSNYIASGNWEEAKEDIKRAMWGNNLTNQWDVIAIIEAPAEALTRALFDLLHGGGPFEPRFASWVNVLTHRTPGVWPSATYFLMLHNPDSDIYVKPTPYQALLRAMGRKAEWPTRPTAKYYEELRELANLLLMRLQPLGAQDMIDVQSFIWFVAQADVKKEPEPIGVPTVARLTGQHAERVYDAAQRFINNALRNDDSLFTPGRAVWTTTNIDELYRHFVEQPDPSKDDFTTKFKRQLEGVRPETYQLAAELLFVYYLPASPEAISGSNKRRGIETVLSWSPQPVELPGWSIEVLKNGISAMGMGFHLFKPFLLHFLIEFARAWKRLPPEQQNLLLNDPWAFKEMLFGLPIHAAQSQREILLHLIHPDTFEAIASKDHKQQIARAFQQYVTQPTNDIDRRLLQIRQRLSVQYGPRFNFYQPGIRELWPTPNGGPSVNAPEPFDALGSDLRSYVRFAVSLGMNSYTAEEMVDLVGRINPPIANLPTAPDPENLAADLMLLRLIEQRDDGRYRRWEHLADATEAHLLRYAALTMLLPMEGKDEVYTLPVMNIPRDGLPHPSTAWPGGEPLLRWYETAHLVQRNGDEWQLRPDALQPMTETTPTAQAINTFLRHLTRAWSREQAGTPFDGNQLPILDPATLDERIAEIQRELLIDRPTILRIYRSLIAGRHVILSGPPGTGKTHLARILPRILWRTNTTKRLVMPTQPEQSPLEEPRPEPVVQQGYAVDVVTATEDWGTRHVIGGIVPQLQENGNGRTLIYGVRHGVLTRTVLQNYGGDGETLEDPVPSTRQPVTIGDQQYRGRWLVIDEFTRAPIDAAFGSLLTTLGGQSNPKIAVPTDAGVDRDVPLPRDFRLIGTLNSFDRHFLNQISEAMKRRFTFIDVLPPGRELGTTEQAMAIYRALLSLSNNNLHQITADEVAGQASWTGVVTVRREETPTDPLTRVRYVLDVADAAARVALDSFWRLFESIRVYRQLGTAQAESIYATMFAGYSIGMNWTDAFDSAVADVLADQLQVLARDEQRVVVALIEHHDNLDAFTDAVKGVLKFMPAPRQMSHLAQLKNAGVATARTIDDRDAAKLQPDQLRDLFRFDLQLNLPLDGLFVRRMNSFINEKGL